MDEDLSNYIQYIADEIISLSYDKQKELIKHAANKCDLCESDVDEYLKTFDVVSCMDCMLYDRKNNLSEVSIKEFLCSSCLEK